METSILKPEVEEVRIAFDKLQELYEKVFPKVDSSLLNDLLSGETKQLQEELEFGEQYYLRRRPLTYTIEVFTKEGIDTDKAREYIYQKTDMMPAIFDNGTHYVTNQVLTLEMLKEISDSDDVLEVRGSYCGGIGMRAAYYKGQKKQQQQH